MSLAQDLNEKALTLGVPLSVHVDLTYRCNERCVHCYLDHQDYGEMKTAEMTSLIDQLAEAGIFYLTFSGGEILLRKDLFTIVEHARTHLFNLKLKTNAILIREAEARRIRELGVAEVQVSIYSHEPEVHDGITKVKGSLERSLKAIRFLRSQGISVTIANVIMRQNMFDYGPVKKLAEELGAKFTIDPTITPMMDGARGVLALNVSKEHLDTVFRDPVAVGDVQDFLKAPDPIDDSIRDGLPCSAGHTACYVSPYGDVYPCVQFPLPCGNVRQQKFIDIWRDSPQFLDVRSIRGRDLTTCSSCSHLGTCTRCPGLAYMEGDMRGPSIQDCEKSYARTGIPTANMLARQAAATRTPYCPSEAAKPR